MVAMVNQISAVTKSDSNNLHSRANIGENQYLLSQISEEKSE